MKLKKILATACMAFAFSCCSAATAPFTSMSAPDAAARHVLAHAISQPWGNLPAGADRLAGIHANFSQSVEQNFARLDATHAQRVIDRLSDKELSDLAKLYVTSNADSGHQGRLLAVLASRLDLARLQRISHHFGFAAVQEALINNAPAMAPSFSMTASVADVGPTPHATISTMTALAAGGGMRVLATGGIGQFIDLTPSETYLALRTAPTGSLGVSGALFETTMIWGAAAYGSWRAGTAIGDRLAPLIETYAPDTWDAIGGTLSEMYDRYRDASTEVKAGQVQRAISGLFGSYAEQVNDFEHMGGDYGAADAWRDWYHSGQGIGCDLYCPRDPIGGGN